MNLETGLISKIKPRIGMIKRNPTTEERKVNHTRLLHDDVHDEMDDNFKIIFNNNPFPTLIYDINTLRFLKVNQAAILKYGYATTEFMKMIILDLRPENDKIALK